MKPTNCKCNLCKSQCLSPCLGTPEDMFKLIGNGYLSRVMRVPVDGMQIITPLYDKEKKSCTFFSNGLCELHDKGLKPTVGKLSHHSTTLKTFNLKKSIHKFVLDEWKYISEEKIQELISKYVQSNELKNDR